MTTNFDEINFVVDELKPLIVVLVETHLTVDVNEHLYAINGYAMHNCFSTSRHTCGVAIYVNTTMKTEIKVNDSSEGNWC